MKLKGTGHQREYRPQTRASTFTKCHIYRTSAWFGDLGDGVHKGDSNDPRISLIQVVPNEIRYWKTNKGRIGRSLEVGVGALTGRTASPGELRTITQDEVNISIALGGSIADSLAVFQLDHPYPGFARRVIRQVAGCHASRACVRTNLRNTSILV